MKVLGDFHGDVFAVEGFEAFDQIFGVVDFCVGPNLLAERDARELKGSAEDAATNHNLLGLCWLELGLWAMKLILKGPRTLKIVMCS